MTSKYRLLLCAINLFLYYLNVFFLWVRMMFYSGVRRCVRVVSKPGNFTNKRINYPFVWRLF